MQFKEEAEYADGRLKLTLTGQGGHMLLYANEVQGHLAKVERKTNI